MMRNVHDRTNVARRMCEAARSAVLGIGLPHTVFDRDLKILLPKIFARTDFDCIDNKLAVCQSFLMIRV